MAPSPPQTPQLPDYGLDAPEAVRRFLSFGTVLVVVHFATPSIVALLPVGLAIMLRGIAPSLAVMGYLFIATAGVLLWGSRVGKLRWRDKLLNALPWRGDEQVLDVGCGHGLMLIGAAKRLSSGRALGIDTWKNAEAMRNRPEAALRNARVEQVAERVEVRTADARELPFDAGRFDLVMSSWALHNLASREERERALREMIRVLKPGGRLLLVDIRYGREYAAFLRAQGFLQVQQSLPNFLFVTPSLSISAVKPQPLG